MGFFQRQTERSNERLDLVDARLALELFREEQSPVDFPHLRRWVERHGADLPSFDLSGFGRVDTWRLTEDEYRRMEAAYQAALQNDNS